MPVRLTTPPQPGPRVRFLRAFPPETITTTAHAYGIFLGYYFPDDHRRGNGDGLKMGKRVFACLATFLTCETAKIPISLTKPQRIA